MELYFGDLKVNNGDFFILPDNEENLKNMSFSWKFNPGKFYTIIMYNKKLPYIKNSNFSNINYLIVNILDNELSEGKEIFPYIEPNIKESKPSTYFFEIYEQPNKFENLKYNYSEKYIIDIFIEKFKLKKIYEITFIIRLKNNRISNGVKEDITEKQAKYCSCVLKVASKQSEVCNIQKKGKGCYNPYAICVSSVGETYRDCGEHYNFKELSYKELVAYATLSKIDISNSDDRANIINKIYEWKRSH
uniref:HeH/LEM domain protein n=1 Tax=Pithovirus LCPAC104 TaxID=2506589 RepID=A0A481Z464_9VIRU|nr:MAG: HeH/LEM domain protein [Pithovirus LCPAC104]